jgi:hypothetical protein
MFRLWLNRACASGDLQVVCVKLRRLHSCRLRPTFSKWRTTLTLGYLSGIASLWFVCAPWNVKSSRSRMSVTPSVASWCREGDLAWPWPPFDLEAARWLTGFTCTWITACEVWITWSPVSSVQTRTCCGSLCKYVVWPDPLSNNAYNVVCPAHCHNSHAVFLSMYCFHIGYFE